ncbi:MAG: aminotransferase class V-fold PLP-dependent enzyme [Actinomyces sp.]|nr:MAG: aminotransferase class V-fold PLP-dependent enzyme [Actinomyces sp.]
MLEGQDPRATARPAAEILADLGPTITADGIGGHEALRRFVDVVVTSTRAQGDPLNLAYVPSAPTPASLVFDLAVSAAEIFAGTWEAGAGAIAAENQALAWLADLAGWPAGAGGAFVQGGTIGNLSALAAGRHAAATARGARPPGGWKIAATADAHSSVAVAARTMDAEILPVPGDERGRLTGDALEATVAGRDDVAAVVVTAGTTNAGIVDDIAGAAAVCARHGLWLHVDGAYGLAALAAPGARPLFAGIEQADSFVVDPHKWLFAPYDCCALVYREPARAAATHAQFAGYLEQIDRGEWNPSDYAIQLTRRPRGLPFWFSLATYGTAAYAAAVEKVLATTRELAAGIDAADHLELLFPPELSVVLFRRPGWSEDEMRAWSRRCARSGVILCVPTRWQGELVFRLCLVNPDTDAAAVLEALETMR